MTRCLRVSIRTPLSRRSSNARATSRNASRTRTPSASYKDKKHPLYQELKNCRDAAKGCNFGKPGGLGAKTMVSYAAKSYGVSALRGATVGDPRALEPAGGPRCPTTSPSSRRLLTALTCGRDAEGRPIRKFNVPQAWSGWLRAGASLCAACNSWYQGLARTSRSAPAGTSFRPATCPASTRSTALRVAWGCLGCMPQNFIHDQFPVGRRSSAPRRSPPSTR